MTRKKVTPHPPRQVDSALTSTGFDQYLEDILADALAVGQGASLDIWVQAKIPGQQRERYMALLPRLSSRRDVQLYIAAVTQGIGFKLIHIAEAKVLIYAAQLALAAFGTANAAPPLQPLQAPKGFTS